MQIIYLKNFNVQNLGIATFKKENLCDNYNK